MRKTLDLLLLDVLFPHTMQVDPATAPLPCLWAQGDFSLGWMCKNLGLWVQKQERKALTQQHVLASQ